jgi:hypothetical protein
MIEPGVTAAKLHEVAMLYLLGIAIGELVKAGVSEADVRAAVERALAAVTTSTKSAAGTS